MADPGDDDPELALALALSLAEVSSLLAYLGPGAANQPRSGPRDIVMGPRRPPERIWQLHHASLQLQRRLMASRWILARLLRSPRR